MEDHQNYKNYFHRAGKIKKPACKILRVWTKNEDNFENCQETFEIFLSNSMENWLFSHFYYILLRFLTPLRKNIPLEDNSRFLQQFSDFGGTGTFRSFYYLPTTMRWHRSQSPYKFKISTFLINFRKKFGILWNLFVRKM